MVLASLLASIKYIIVNKDLIHILGLNEAVILGELCSEYTYWADNGKLENDDYFYSTRENIEKNTGINPRHQRIALKNLEELGIITTQKRRLPYKIYYKINESKIIGYLKNDFESAKNLDVQKLNNKALKIETSRNIGNEQQDVKNLDINNNNINNNKIDKFFNYIINKEKAIPEEFAKVDNEKILTILKYYDMLYTKKSVSYMSEKNLKRIKEIMYVIALIVKHSLEHLTYKVSRDKLIQLYNDCKLKQKGYKYTNKKIKNFINYYYKTVENELLKGSNPSFFMPEKE